MLGLDPVRDANALQRRIGVQLQQAQLQKRIRGTAVKTITRHFWRDVPPLIA